MRLLLPALLVSLATSTAFAEKFSLDISHTGIQFTVPHLVVSKVKGRFDKFEGTFDFDEKTQKLDNISIEIAADSINTNEKDRDKDLRGPNFLDVTKFPKLTFKSTKTIYDHAKPEKVEGLLTIHGVTKPVTLKVEYKGAVTDPWGNRRVAFEAETKIDRRNFGLVWNKAIEAGGFVVGDEVKISIDGEAMVAKAK
ncbi:YceI family protein [Bdellovibrio svalbardensis]|uniref:YceI family protein n=1 Tax=Bdellovibrio svalbardensis TaxID=2972972 RepID=A0ABT6DFL3_9BACT|nr:YceI family protein [Bdellovibrio svalbardensis]MDG0815640.1 YceI family protein [Bdellovibrio svalbardensis]